MLVYIIMDLPTHFVFALAAGLVFTNNPEVALMVGLGALLPDLDREYWFIPIKVYADEQIHRAGLHNVFIMAAIYVISPYLSLGIFLHVLQDSFTTVKDRGVEWFYPFTRLVKRGRLNCEGAVQPLDPKERIYFYQEDPPGLAKKADADLQSHHYYYHHNENECRPIPWRRVYGFAQNGQILDRCFLVGSVAVILIWLFAPGNALHVAAWKDVPSANYRVAGLGFVAVVTLFIAGELDRRGGHAKRPSLSRAAARLGWLKYAVFGLGIMFLVFWGMLMAHDIENNVKSIFLSNPASLVMVMVIVPIIVFGIARWKTRGGREGIV